MRSSLASTAVVGLIIGFVVMLMVMRPPRDGAQAVAVPVRAAASAVATAPVPLSTSAPLPPDGVKSSALFVRNHGMASDPDLASEYDDVNNEYFSNILPPPQVRWESGLEDLGPLIAENFVVQGLTDGRMILLNPTIEHNPDQRRRALCHEMVHMAVWLEDNGHGPIFQERLRQLSLRGAFKGIVATDQEKNAALDAIKREHTDLETEDHALQTARASLDRTSKTAVDGFNDRVRRQKDAIDEYNHLVEQYNLMVSYPDGLARDRLKARADGTMADDR
jgi:hypothetical protein